MARNEWQRRIERAEKLAGEYPAASEVLHFLAAIMDYQQTLWQTLESDPKLRHGVRFEESLPDSLTGKFKSFLRLVVEKGPAPLSQSAKACQTDESAHGVLLNSFWQGRDGALAGGANEFLARAFLQPYAVLIRSRQEVQPKGPTPCLCPVCGRKPGSGVLRPQGDGGLRSLICSFCLNEWEFRRILCPACGEENHAKLPVYTAEEFPHVRVECCDSCRCYIKTVDMTKSGLADPVVDEIAAIPLDLWAEQQGYAKLQRNLMQM